MKKKLLSIVMSMMMVFTMIPMMGGVAFAEEGDKVLTEINLTYDADTVDLNTAWTEGQVNVRARDNVSTDTAGIEVDPSNSGLRYKVSEGNYYGIGDGTNYVTSDKEYYLCFRVIPLLSDGYTWLETVPEGLTVKVNGVDMTSSCYLDFIGIYDDGWFYIYAPIGAASTTPLVTGVSINDSAFSMAAGETHSFTGTVTGTVEDKGINWSVSGATSESTTIDEAGLLTVGNDETSELITVTATAKADSTKSASLNVTVVPEPPTIESVQIIGNWFGGYTGSTLDFSANVEGTQTDKSVTWSIEGAQSDKTKVESTGDGSCQLTIGADETAETVKLIATANKDATKTSDATITVKQKTRVTAVNLSYDANAIDLDSNWTEGEVKDRVRANISTATEGIEIDASNSHLMFLMENGSLSGVGDGSQQVSEDKDYYIGYCLNPKTGYDWPESAKKTIPSEISGIAVTVNGQDVTADCSFDYNSYWNRICVYAPVGKAEVPHVATAALSTTRYTYNGYTKNPTLTVKDEKGNVLTKDVDYEVTVPSGRKSVGQYTYKIKGIGDYSGELSASFQIVPKTASIKSITPGTKKLTVKATTKPSSKYGKYYQIAYKQKGTSSWKYTYTSASYKTIKNLKKGKQYYVKMRAYKKVGSTTYYGSWSSTKLSKKIK